MSDRGAGGPAASRRALVFGGGGVLGFAWTVGALSAWEEYHGLDAREVAVTLGTSAGSVIGALLGCGVAVDVVRRHHQGVPAPADPSVGFDLEHDSGGSRPPRPGWRPGSPRLLLAALRHPRGASAAVALSGLLPRGRGSLGPVHDLIAEISLHGLTGRSWPERPRTWVVATDYDTGARVVFGRDDVPAALADAVAASCAIPAWYEPVRIADRPFIDGGTASNASVDALRSAVEAGTIDRVDVFAPMAAHVFDRPRSPMARLERVVRRAITRGIDADAELLRRAGAEVRVLTPGPDDLEAMGPNLMNPARRSEVLRMSLGTSMAALRGTIPLGAAAGTSA